MWTCNMCRKKYSNKSTMFFWSLEGERYQEEVCSKCNRDLIKLADLEQTCNKFKEQLRRRGENSDRYFASLKEGIK